MNQPDDTCQGCGFEIQDCQCGLYLSDREEEEPEQFGCCLKNCIMVGVHYPNECHTAEMYEDYADECRRQEQDGEVPDGILDGEVLG